MPSVSVSSKSTCASSNARVASNTSRRAAPLRAVLRVRQAAAARASSEARLPASRPTARVRSRSTRPCTRARRMNSPRAAGRAPAATQRRTTSVTTAGQPGKCNSTTSSPVSECGARNTRSSTGTGASSCSTRRARFASPVHAGSRSNQPSPRHPGLGSRVTVTREYTIVRAAEPDSLTIARSPCPGAVAGATMVSTIRPAADAGVTAAGWPCRRQ